MGTRRKARECALQILFQLELNPSEPGDLIRTYWTYQKAGQDIREYGNWLVETTLARRAEIDQVIQAASRNWRLARMSVVDRNILRIAVGELIHAPTLTAAIVINEAIEIAKRYSGQESAVFVNGVLDAVRLRLESGKAAPAAAEEGHHGQERKEPATGKKPRARRKPAD